MNALMLADLQKSQEAFYGCGALLFLVAAAMAVAAAFGGVLAMAMVVAPNLTHRSTEALRHRNLLSFLAGLPFLGLLVVFGVLGKKFPVVGGLGVLALGVFALVGLAASSEDIGRRLYWACGREGSRLTHLFAGWAVLIPAACLPFVGWFVVAPYVVVSGLGSLLVGAIRRESAPGR